MQEGNPEKFKMIFCFYVSVRKYWPLSFYLALVLFHRCHVGKAFRLGTLSVRHTFDLDCFPKRGLITGWLEKKKSLPAARKGSCLQLIQQQEME